MLKTRVRNAVKSRLNFKQDALRKWPAVLGDTDGVVVIPDHPNYPNYVYARMFADEAVQEVFNNRAPNRAGYRVYIGYTPEEPNLLQVLGTRSDAPAGVGGGAAANFPPASRYRWMAPGGGDDPLYVELRQFMPLRVGMYSLMTLQVYRGVVWTGTAYATVATQTVDLTSHIPSTTGKAAFVLITVNTSGAIVATKGTEVNLADLGADDVPAAPAGTVKRLAAIRVYYGQTAVQEARTNTDIVDLRFADDGGDGTPGLSFSDAEGDPVAVDATAAADGTSDYAARRDHRHQLGSHSHTEGDITDLDHTDSNAIHSNASGEIAALTEKEEPAEADWLIIEDSEASNAKKKVQVGNLPGGTSGASAFTDLTDAFASYSGLGGEYVKVKVTEDGLETGTPEGSGSGLSNLDGGAAATVYGSVTGIDGEGA